MSAAAPSPAVSRTPIADDEFEAVMRFGPLKNPNPVARLKRVANGKNMFLIYCSKLVDPHSEVQEIRTSKGGPTKAELDAAKAHYEAKEAAKRDALLRHTDPAGHSAKVVAQELAAAIAGSKAPKAPAAAPAPAGD